MHLAEPSEQFSILCAAEGRARAVALAVPDWLWRRDAQLNSEREFVSAYWRFADALVETTASSLTFVVITNSSSEPEAHAWRRSLSAPERIVVVPVADELRFTVWCNDIGLIAYREAVLTCLEPIEFPRADDSSLLPDICAATGLIRVRSPLFFQGGNVVCTETTVIVGRDDRDALARIVPDIGEDEITAAYAHTLGGDRELLFVGTVNPLFAETVHPLEHGGEDWSERAYVGSPKDTHQPVFHIDMFITPMGRDRNGQETVAVGDPALARRLAPDLPLRDELDCAFDAIAADLSAAGIKVIRTPLPWIPVDDPELRRRTWYFASSNNAIVEPTTRQVWLPSYGSNRWASLVATDAANRTAWEQQGYRVTMLPDAHALAASHGGPNCLVKCLARAR
jgi:hypothetical protein